ncbi:MAG: hypothetical protein QF915_03055 [Candidatus Woesearchaeota archaeon]|jgi:hypothetical protein|nr:hypothetical protein [Candidatus Woesearchaeota archaeon]|tara:strand:+ start:747 stop:962 length:216 start_codon:yes stop_codon:yes gene_type:complete
MIHENQQLREQGLLSAIVDLMVPESYRAFNVQDFYDNRHTVQETPPHKYISVLPAFYGFDAIIKLKGVNVE